MSNEGISSEVENDRNIMSIEDIGNTINNSF